MATADSMKKLLDEFAEKEHLISEERTAVEGQIRELEARLQECSGRIETVVKDRERVLSFKERYGSMQFASNGGGPAKGAEGHTDSDEPVAETGKSDGGSPTIGKAERRTLFAQSRMAGKEAASGVADSGEPAAAIAKPGRSPFAKASQAAAGDAPAPAPAEPKTIEPPTVSVPDRSHATGNAATAEAAAAADAEPRVVEPVAGKQPDPQTMEISLPQPVADSSVTAQTAPATAPIPVAMPVNEASPLPGTATPSAAPAAAASTPSVSSPAAEAPKSIGPSMSTVERFSAQFAKDASGVPNSNWISPAMDAEMPVPQVDEPPKPPLPSGGISSLLADLSSDSNASPVAPPVPAAEAPITTAGDLPPMTPAMRSGIDSLLRRPPSPVGPSTTGDLAKPAGEALPGQQAVFGDASQEPGQQWPPPQPVAPPVAPQPVAPQPVAPQLATPPQPVPPPMPTPPQPVAPAPPTPPQPRGPQAPVAPPAQQDGAWGGMPEPETAQQPQPQQPAPQQEAPQTPAQPGSQTVDLNAVEGQEEEGDGDTVKSINDALRSLFR